MIIIFGFINLKKTLRFIYHRSKKIIAQIATFNPHILTLVDYYVYGIYVKS